MLLWGSNFWSPVSAAWRRNFFTLLFASGYVCRMYIWLVLGNLEAKASVRLCYLPPTIDVVAVVSWLPVVGKFQAFGTQVTMIYSRSAAFHIYLLLLLLLLLARVRACVCVWGGCLITRRFKICICHLLIFTSTFSHTCFPNYVCRVFVHILKSDQICWGHIRLLCNFTVLTVRTRRSFGYQLFSYASESRVLAVGDHTKSKSLFPVRVEFWIKTGFMVGLEICQPPVIPVGINQLECCSIGVKSSDPIHSKPFQHLCLLESSSREQDATCRWIGYLLRISDDFGSRYLEHLCCLTVFWIRASF
jgi:hypothetical protein